MAANVSQTDLETAAVRHVKAHVQLAATTPRASSNTNATSPAATAIAAAAAPVAEVTLHRRAQRAIASSLVTAATAAANITTLRG